MARTLSTMPALGMEAPDFTLPDPEGRMHRLADVCGEKGLLVIFICNHCPFVKHVRDELARLGRDAVKLGIGVVGINANDISQHPDDSPEHMARESKEAGYTFPYLFDETQQVARAYRAACTPDFFLFDADARLVYRGQLDDSRPGSGIPVTGRDLRAALESVARGEVIRGQQVPSMGCNIKWKPGNAPEA
jgi:peroxiredoxin